MSPVELEQTTWNLPFSVWHNDFVPFGAGRRGPRAVQFFLLLNDIQPATAPNCRDRPRMMATNVIS